MAKLFIVAVLAICLSLKTAYADDAAAVAAAVAAGNPADNIIETFNDGISKGCPKVCADGCKYKKSSCFDIPKVIDCAAKEKACQADCDSLCGCVAACPTKCKACPAEGEDAAAGLQCAAKHSLCLKFCELKCPIDQFTKKITEVLQGLAKEVQKLIGSFAKKAAAAAPAASRR